MVVVPPPPRGAAMDGHELAEDVAAPDDQPGRLAAELEVLRDETDRREGKDLRAFADLGPAVDDRRRAHPAVGTEADVRADHGERPDRRPCADLRLRMHDRGRIDLRCESATRTSRRSASATI